MHIRRSHYAIAAMMILFAAPIAYTMMMCLSEGLWPADWPKALEPLRDRAETCHFMGSNEGMIYNIPFESRVEFEKLWPVLLSLKGKGEPLYLFTIDPPVTDPEDMRVVHTTPQIHISCPMLGRYRKNFNGSYELTSSRDVASELLVKSISKSIAETEYKGQWAPLHPGTDSKEFGLLDLARVELTLYVDGEIIDLKRIRFPKDTPFIDRRRLGWDE